MRLLNKFLIVSVAGLATVVAALSGIGIGVIDNVVYQNHIHVLRVELTSIERQLSALPPKSVVRHDVVLKKLEAFGRGTGDSYFAYRLDGKKIFPEAASQPQFSPQTVSELINKRLGEGWIEAGNTRYLARYVVLSDRNLMLGVRIPEDTVYAERKRYLIAVGGAALIVLIVGSILAYFAARVIARRIGVTLDALASVSTGEFGVRIPDTAGQDELSQIQRRINDLADSFARRANERDAATRWLEENEKRFRDFAEAASDAFWETDFDHRYTFFSNPATDFGHFHDNHDIVGTIRGQYFKESGFYAGDWEQHIEDLNHHRIIRDFEFSGQYPDGKIFHRTSSAVPVFDEHGVFTGYRGTTTDITDRIETQQKFQNLITNLPGIVFQRLLYPDDRIDYSHLSTSSADWLDGTTAEDRLAAWRSGEMAHPEDRDRLRRFILERARSGNAFSTEFRAISRDGKLSWHRAVCSAPSTRPDGVIIQDGVVFDITDIKKAQEEAQTSERRLADFAIAASDTLWETDIDHRLTWMSDPETRENRYYNTNVMIGRRRWEFPGVAPREDPCWAPLIKALGNIQPFRDFEFESRLEDGKQVYRRISGRPVFNENGDFTGYRGISTDITERVLKDREARETQQRLIDAIEASDQGIVLFGADDRLIFANRYALNISPELTEVFVPGVKYEEMVRRAARDGNFPDAAGSEEAWVQARLAYHKAPSGPFTNIRSGGRYIEIREQRLSNGGWIIRQTDVTDQTLAQDALRTSEERFRDFAESSSDWMWESDSEHRITWISESVRAHTDLPIEQIVGATRWGMLGLDLEADPHWKSLADTMDSHDRIRDFRYERQNTEGKRLHRSISGVAFYNDDGVFQGYRGAVTDTTALIEAEQAEQRFLNAINTADEGLILLDLDDNLVFANRTARNFLGENGAALDAGVSFADILRHSLSPDALSNVSAEHDAYVEQSLRQHRNMADSKPIVVHRTNGMVLEIREEVLADGSCIIFQNDITARIKTENELIESRQRFQDFAEASSDWLWETDTDFKFTSATGGAEGSEDLTPTDFIGRTRWESIGVDVENDENWRDHIDDLIAHRPFRNFRYSRISPGGRVLHRSTSGVPYYSPVDGAFLGYRGTTADITDQVEAEQRYRNLIEQSPTPMIVHDGETMSYLNTAAVELTGAKSAAELTDRSVIDFVHPDEREGFRERVKNVLEDGNVSPITEQRRLRVDGSEITVMTRGVPIMWDGKRAVLGALMDITDRVQAERQYRQLIEAAPMALSIDDGSRFIFVNQAFAEMFGVDSAEQVIGRELTEMAHPDDLDQFHDRVRAVTQYRRTLPTAQIPRRRFDGGTLTVLSKGVPIQWEGRPATLGIQVDISERIEAQQALEESEERFRSLVEGSRQGVLIHIDYAPVFVNAALAQMFGYESEKELLSLTSVLDLVAPEAREQWRTNRSARLSGLEVESDYEFPGLRKDGSKIWIHMTVRLVNWQNRTAIQGTMIDVTRRREAEGRIRESEERFRLLTSTSPVGIFVTDAEGSCEYINEAYEKMSGVPAAQASGQGWATSIHPEDKDRVFEEWYAGVRTERPFRTEFRFLRADGTITWGIAQAVAQRDSSGRTLKFIGAVTDVTGRVRAELARKNSDDRFRTLTTLSPVGVFLTDEDGRVEYVNGALAKMLKLRPEEAFGRNWMSGIHRDDRQALLSAWEEAYAARKNLEMELRMGGDGDEITWVLVQASPLRSDGHAGDNAGGYVGAVTDITERRLAEEQLRQVQKMDAIGQLTGGIAHDFNNLLAIVQGNLELLRERAPDDDRLTSLINAAHGAARRGATLNQRLLAFARRQPLTPSACDINEIVGDMAGLFVRTLGDNVDLQTHFAEGLWPTNIDPNGLETAVLNLAINARDAMPDGGALIITTANRSYGTHRAAPDSDIPDGDYVLLRVTDSGTGMDGETLEKAFDPFYTTKGMGKGSGLGLSMVYGFARQSGGTAIVESAIGRGTSISLLFPRTDEEMIHLDAAPIRTAPEGAGERILIVEDDNDVRDMAIGMFESLNYKTLTASSAEEALTILDRDSDIELLFTDVMLGSGDNGPELAKKARQGHPGLRILFASGYATEEFENGTPLELGALLNKPYERADLAQAVGVALDTGRA